MKPAAREHEHFAGTRKLNRAGEVPRSGGQST
jgi:hypothetical protein